MTTKPTRRQAAADRRHARHLANYQQATDAKGRLNAAWAWLRSELLAAPRNLYGRNADRAAQTLMDMAGTLNRLDGGRPPDDHSP